MADVTSDLNSLFKIAYGDVVNQIPDFAKLQKKTKFIESKKETGNTFSFPITTNYENSFSFASSDGGLFDLKPLRGLSTKLVSIKGQNIVLRAGIDYESLARSSNDVKAFEKGTSFVVKNMIESGNALVETMLFYGETELGKVTSTTNVSTTKTTLNFNSATWASGIFSGRVGAYIDLYNTLNTIPVTGTENEDIKIVAVDSANSKLTVESTSGVISAIDSYGASNTMHVWFQDTNAKSMTGLKKIITNTGTLFGVDSSTVDYWAGNSYNVNGAITIAKIFEALSLSIDRGLMSDVDLYLPSKAWNKVMTDQASLRSYDHSYNSREAKNGNESLTFFSANGKITVNCSPVVKNGEGFIIPTEYLKRPGATDWKFDSGTDDNYFFPIPDKSGREIRLYTNQAVILTRPALATYLYGITY